MAINSKKKGNRGELEFVHILCDRFGEGKFKRTPSSGAYTGGKNREAAKNLPWEAKITLASDIITPANFRFIVEHKFYGEISFWELFSDKSNWNDWADQACGDAEFVNKQPLIVIKYNRHNRIALVNKNLLPQENPIRTWFIWPHNQIDFAVVEAEELIKLPDDFWFEEMNG